MLRKIKCHAQDHATVKWNDQDLGAGFTDNKISRQYKNINVDIKHQNMRNRESGMKV